MNNLAKYPIRIIAIGLAMLALAMPLVAQLDAPITTVLPVFRWTGDDTAIEGAEAVLIRMEHGISMSFETFELEPGEIYTAWWVIFNNPENCSDADCLLDDIFLMDGDEFMLDHNGRRQPNRMQRDTAQITQMRATSAVADDNGYAMFRAHLPVGDTSDYVDFGPGLIDPMAAEIHVVLRTHGQPDPEHLWDQHFTAWGGCPDPDNREPCKNVQFATFKP